MASDAAVKALIEGLYGVALVTQGEVSAAALWAYDYFLTLGMEIELVWTTKWNIIKVLFLVQRYLPLIDTCILTLYRDLMPQTERNCSRLETTTGFMYVTGYAVAEILLSLRVWAVWNRSKTLAFLLPIAFIVIWSPAFIFMYYFTLSLRFSPAPPYPGARGCFIIFAKDYVKWCWTSLIIWNSLTLSLMLIPGVRLYQSRLKSSLTMVVYRDGTFYFVYLFVLSLLNIILSVVLTPNKKFVLSSLERCLHAALASRVILHMRDHARNSDEWELTGLSAGFAGGGDTNTTTIASQVNRRQNFKTRDLE